MIVTVEGKKCTNIHQERSDLSNSRGKWHERHADQRWKSYNEKADCKDQICADHKAIEKSGETIVCLPHKVVIEIRSEDGKEQELDGVTQ